MHPGGALVGRVGQFPNSRPARAGDIILVFGTGFGPTIPATEPGMLADAVPLAGPVTARIGALFLTSSEILYAGAAPSFAGLQQFNLRIPAGLEPGELPLVLTSRGFQTQPGVVLAIER